MNGRWARGFTLIVLSAALAHLPATAADSPSTPPATPIQHASAKAVDHWRDARFGMFIHWGPVSLKGTEIGWSRGAQVPSAEYDQLYRSFNPVQFNAAEWVALAKATGMRYMVFTTRHHDGFSMWDTRLSDYNVMRSPFGRDVVKELSQACRKGKLDFGIYYSICDWWHPDYPNGSPGGTTPKPSPNMPRFVDYLKGQLAELRHHYGPFWCFWFDGEWEKPWTPELGIDLNNYVRSLQPDVIVNNRVGKGRQGMEGVSDPNLHPGDYWTPEQEVGAFQRNIPWETCMTICQQWAWKPNDKLKSLEDCLAILVGTIGGDGNLLLNVGPMPDGRIEPRQADRLREIGAFVKQNQAAIYGSRGGPFKPGPWGASTCKGKEVYVFVRTQKSPTQRSLPTLAGATVRSAKDLHGGRVAFEQTDRGLVLHRPTQPDAAPFWVVRLTLDRPAFGLTPSAVTN